MIKSVFLPNLSISLIPIKVAIKLVMPSEIEAAKGSSIPAKASNLGAN